MNNQAGGSWLHRVKHLEARARVPGELERELKRKAEKWLDDGVDEDEVIERVKALRRVLGGAL